MDLLNKINTQIFNPIIKLLIAVGVVVFLYGVVEFIAASDNEEKRSTGRKHIIWGVVGLFIMISVFGIMHLLADFWE